MNIKYKKGNELIEKDNFLVVVNGKPELFQVKFIENKKVFVDVFTKENNWVPFKKEGIPMSQLENCNFVVMTD